MSLLHTDLLASRKPKLIYVIDLTAQGLETAVRVHGHTTRDLVLMAGALACAVAKLPHLAVLSGR